MPKQWIKDIENEDVFYKERLERKDEYIDASNAEDTMKKFCKGGKKVSNKVLDYFGVKKKIDCEFSIDPVTEYN